MESEEWQMSRKERRTCKPAGGFLGPIIEPLTWIWSVWRWSCPLKGGKLSGVDGNTNNGVETRLNKFHRGSNVTLTHNSGTRYLFGMAHN